MSLSAKQIDFLNRPDVGCGGGNAQKRQDHGLHPAVL